VREIQARGRRGLAIPSDLSRPGEPEAMVARTLEVFGHLDILVNNAAITFDGDLAMPMKRWDLVMEVNVRAPLLAMRAARPAMKAGGQILNISSAAAVLPIRGLLDWGIGEFADLAPLVRWLAAAGHGLLQLLPIVETAPGERSPYTVLSAFAIDSIYLALREVEDFVAAGGEAALAPDDRTRLDGAREQANIDYDAVRAVKRRALEIAFEHFLATEWRGRSARAAAFEGFRAAEADWLDSYSLFRACKESRDEGPWTAWEPALR